QIGRPPQDLPLEGDENPGCLLRVRTRTDAELHIGPRELEILEESLRHVVVVVLARVHEDLLEDPGPLAHLGEDRRRLHEIRPRAHHVHHSHRWSHATRTVSPSIASHGVTRANVRCPGASREKTPPALIPWWWRE